MSRGGVESFVQGVYDSDILAINLWRNFDFSLQAFQGRSIALYFGVAHIYLLHRDALILPQSSVDFSEPPSAKDL